MTTILVTGPTGTIGSQVVKALLGKPGVTVKAAVRPGSKAVLPSGVTAVDFDYDAPATIAKAVTGVDALFLLTPFVPNQVELGKRLVDAAKAAGVRHIVKLSAIGADSEPGIQLGRWHREVERYIEASGIAYTFLRPNGFADNFIGYYPPQKDGNIYLPFGTGAVSFIDARDVGAAAAAVLTSPGHEGKAYDLTGPAAITADEAAKALSQATGKPIRYVDVPEDAARKAMADAGAPGWMVSAMMELHGICKAGWAGAVTDTVEKLTGAKARSFAEFARHHAAKWA